MIKEEMISIQEFCILQNVEPSFVFELSESGLLEITITGDIAYIHCDELPGLEKLVRLHYDMDINLEGIEAIHHLLRQMKIMQQEMRSLKSRLGIYERVE